MNILIALALIQATSLPGIWSVGETPNCQTGEAWIFTADGYYVELTLPGSPIDAVGLWEDKGDRIEYTHAHMPFAGHEKPQDRRAYRITTRTNDRIEALNYKGERRVFSRCEASALVRPTSQP